MAGEVGWGSGSCCLKWVLVGRWIGWYRFVGVEWTFFGLSCMMCMMRAEIPFCSEIF